MEDVREPIQDANLDIAGGIVTEGVRLCYFQTGSADLLSQHQDWLTQIFIPKLKQFPNAAVTIVGFASRVGSDQANKVLSEQRAANVERFIRSQHLKVNIAASGGTGESIAKIFKDSEQDNSGYWRAVFVTWQGIPPKLIPLPKIKLPKFKKPTPISSGGWLITGVDAFGVPLPVPPPAEASTAIVTLTLVNSKGEKHIIKGIGAGGGVGVDVVPSKKHANAVIDGLIGIVKGMGLKAGDLQNVFDALKQLNPGSSMLAGAILKRASWEDSNLTFKDITQLRSFTIGSGELQFAAGGGEAGLILFGTVPVTFTLLDPLAVAGMLTAGVPWGFYGGAGLTTLKAAIGLSSMFYTIIEERKVE